MSRGVMMTIDDTECAYFHFVETIAIEWEGGGGAEHDALRLLWGMVDRGVGDYLSSDNIDHLNPRSIGHHLFNA